MPRILTLLLLFTPLSFGNGIEWVKSKELSNFDSVLCSQAMENIKGILKRSNDIYNQGLTTIKPLAVTWQSNTSRIKIVAITASDTCGSIGCSAVLFIDQPKNCVISNVFNIIQPMESVGLKPKSIFIKNGQDCNSWKLEGNQLLKVEQSKEC